jgi:hypothetical protein
MAEWARRNRVGDALSRATRAARESFDGSHLD